jgi:ferredoxin
MQAHGRRVLLCNCRRTMTIDGERIAAALGSTRPVVCSELCRAQIDNFRDACRSGEPLLVACTQEAPLFHEVAADEGVGEKGPADVRYVNIRERAGWSDQGGRAAAKMAALIAEAALDLAPTPAVTLRSDGVVLVYGVGETAMAAARRLRQRVNVTCVLRRAEDVMPPDVADLAVYRGTIRAAKGYLGAFELTIDDFAPSLPWSRQAFVFDAGRDGARITCDVILDLSGSPPLFPRVARREGYLYVEPSDRLGMERALFDVLDLVGEFEKPRYVRFDAAICAHARNGKVGCRNCLDVCPSGAIVPDGDHVAIDPFICVGHGACASVCPTGAATFDLPSGYGVFERLRTLLRTYDVAGGTSPVLLVHDVEHGEPLISAMARQGNGLPAHVLPFAIAEVTAVGLDLLLTALAYGAARVHLLVPPRQRDALAPLAAHAAIIDAISDGLGLGMSRVIVDDSHDIERLGALLSSPPPRPVAAAKYAVMGDKRSTLRLALNHLHAMAPQQPDIIPLPAGAPFGTLVLNQQACTLCLACVGVCPTAALGDHPDRPHLSFIEGNCVQCGLCRVTCPEHAIALQPQLRFGAAAMEKRVLKEEEPFRCERCGKAFGARTTIERMIERLAEHAMFASPERLALLKLCDDCRVIAQFEEAAPMASRPRPPPRTTEDYLRDRDAKTDEA